MLEGVRSYSVFHTKKFLEKIFGKWWDEWLRVGKSVVFVDKISSHFTRSSHCESDARDFSFLKNKNPQKNL